MNNIFYKYLNAENGLKTLNNLCLRLSDPSTLNDPFEFNPITDLSDITFDEATEFWRSDEGLKIIYEGKQVVKPFAEFKKQFLNDKINGFINQWMGNRCSIAKQVDYRKTIKSRFHIVCGSENPTSILMWSHYAKDHTGIVLGFDKNAFPFPEFHETGNILSINYVSNRPIYKHRLIADTNYRLSEFRRIASAKYKDWEYEQEIRIVVPLGQKTIGEHIKQGKDGYYLILEPKNISTVILGAKTKPNNKKEVQLILKNKGFDHVLLQQIILDNASFGLKLKS